MAVDNTKIIIGAPNQSTTGAVACAAVGTALPTTATDTLPAGIAIWLPNCLYTIIAIVLYIKAPK